MPVRTAWGGLGETIIRVPAGNYDELLSKAEAESQERRGWNWETEENAVTVDGELAGRLSRLLAAVYGEVASFLVRAGISGGTAKTAAENRMLALVAGLTAVAAKRRCALLRFKFFKGSSIDERWDYIALARCE